MTDEQKPKRTRKANPFSTWKRARAAAEAIRRRVERLERLAAEAEQARSNAEAAKRELVEAEAAEKAAYEALQAELGDSEGE